MENRQNKPISSFIHQETFKRGRNAFEKHGEMEK